MQPLLHYTNIIGNIDSPTCLLDL